MVVMIIAIIAAIAIPRLSRGAAQASINAAARDENILNKAAEMYRSEHWRYPGGVRVVSQLTQFTDDDGDPNPTRSRRYYLGPYLAAIPPAPIGWQKGATGVAQSPGAGIGWLYNPRNGQFRISLTAGDTPMPGDEIPEAVVEAVIEPP